MRRLGLALVLFAAAARADIEPGNWEISASTELRGIKEPVTMTQTRCLSAEEARDPGRLFGSSPAARCQFTQRADSGSVFTFEIVCEGQQRMSGAGSVRYGRNAIDGELEIKSDSFFARSRIAARRLGACQ